MGWEVSAFDQSEAGKAKALQLAEKHAVKINYDVVSLEDFVVEKESFDLIVLIFAHFPGKKRKVYHRQLIQYLKPRGVLILEGFSKSQIEFNTVNERAGGPKDMSMLFSTTEMVEDFGNMEILSLEEQTVNLKEGLYHVGDSAVVRLVARKSK
jgi:2-polyprenyl-3-methyl-5-hydroxy-6-metoxy-1,4-benzoquinol methylase